MCACTLAAYARRTQNAGDSKRNSKRKPIQFYNAWENKPKAARTQLETQEVAISNRECTFSIQKAMKKLKMAPNLAAVRQSRWASLEVIQLSPP